MASVVKRGGGGRQYATEFGDENEGPLSGPFSGPKTGPKIRVTQQCVTPIVASFRGRLVVPKPVPHSGPVFGARMSPPWRQEAAPPMQNIETGLLRAMALARHSLPGTLERPRAGTREAENASFDHVDAVFVGNQKYSPDTSHTHSCAVLRGALGNGKFSCVQKSHDLLYELATRRIESRSGSHFGVLRDVTVNVYF